MILKHLEDGTCKTFSVDGEDDKWVMRLAIPGMEAETGYDFIWYKFTDDGWETVSKDGKVNKVHGPTSQQSVYENAYRKGLA